MFKNCSAGELADLLESMVHHPHNTGGLSMLDEATLAFGARDARIGEAQRAFADARQRHHRSYDPSLGGYSHEAWERAMTAAKNLAALLRPLGDTRIARCGRSAEWGLCNLPLDDDGVCRSPLGHTDDGR